MQTVSEEFKTAIASPSPDFKSRITFPDLVLDDYQVRSINLDSLLVGSEDFEIGMAPMDMVQIELVCAPDEPIEYDFEGKECEIELGVHIPFTYNRMETFTYGELEQYTYDEMEEGTPENVALGLFTVEKATKGVMILTLDCVDRMYKAEKEYVSDLMYPTTLLDILESACDQAGIELATTTFANSDYIVPNEPVYEGVTCRKVFAQVAELAGGYAKINRLGQLEIVTLGNESVRDITKDHYFDLKINEVAEASIDKVIVKVGEETATKGDGENIYTIVDNMFVQDPNNVVDALYSVLKNVSYTACTLKWQGDFSLDLGDKVTVDGNDTYVLSRKLTYTGGLREDYSAPAKSNIEKESTGKGSLTLDIENVKTRIKVIDGEIKETVEEIDGEVSSLESRVQSAEQKITADAIVQTVRESTAYQGDLAAKGDKSVLDSAVSTISQHATQISQRVEKNKIISEINQTAETIKIQASKIKFEGLVTANSNFKILSDGSIQAKNADISGRVTANSGAIGGWQLTSSLIQYRPNSSNNNSRFYLDSGPTGTYRIASYNSSGTRQFSVTRDGVLYARNADISGNITATSGTIGGWDINQNNSGSLRGNGSDGSYFYIAPPDSSYTYLLSVLDSTGTWKTRITKEGVLRAQGADITGKITATSGSFPASLITGALTATQINVSTLSSITSNLGTITGGSLNIGNGAFKVSSAGKLEATGADISGRVTANSGAIGGWQLTSSLIQYRPNSSNNNSRFYLNSDPTGTYRIASYNSSGTRQFSVTSDGVLYARNADITGDITATSGTIGGWNITGSYIDTRDGNARMYLASHADSASYYIHASNSSGSRMFSVSKTGVLYARNADISGNITSSTITSSTITGGTIRTGSGNNRIELSNNLLRSYSGGVRRVQLDYDSLDFYTQSAKKMGEIFAVDVDMGDDVVPVLRISADTGAVELRFRRSASNFALLRLSADHPEYEWDGHMLTVMIESGSDYGALTVGAGGVRIEGSAVGALIDGNSTISGNFEPQGVNSFNLGSSSMYWKNVYAGNFVNRSERIAKENIRQLDTGTMYDKVKTISPYSYQYKEDDAEHIGVIADESPEEILDESGTGISLYAYTTMLLGALQETIKKVEKLEEDIKRSGNAKTY